MARPTVARFWRELERDIRAGKRAALTEAAKTLQREVLRELDAGSPGKGRAYRRGGKIHRASVAGSAPATDSGDLRRAIGTQLLLAQDQALVGVKRPVSYAAYLDPPPGKGEPKIRRRPILSVVYRRMAPKLRLLIGEELDRALRRARL